MRFVLTPLNSALRKSNRGIRANAIFTGAKGPVPLALKQESLFNLMAIINRFNS